VSSWTNNGGDLRSEALTPPIRVPLVIWVDTAVVNGATAPLQDLVNTNALFFDQMVGVDFDTSPTVVRDRTTDLNAKAIIGYGCDSAPGVRTSAYYVEGALNVYYVHNINSGNDEPDLCLDDRSFELHPGSRNRACTGSTDPIQWPCGWARGCRYTDGIRC